MGSRGVTWPFVALALVAVAGVVAMFALSNGQDRSAILALLSSLCSAVVAGYFGYRINAVEKKIDKVDHQTNGVPNVTVQSGTPDVQRGQSTGDSRWIPYSTIESPQRNDER